MPITAKDFGTHYPKLYHMAEAGSWPLIQKHGLLSTAALLDLYKVTGCRRHQIEAEHRPNSVNIPTMDGPVTIRDQKPMSEKALSKCLHGMTGEEWYRLLNGLVFFWVTEERLNKMLHAAAYRDRKHTVITIDTQKLLEKYSKKILLSPINSGCTLFNPQPRGRDTFRPLSEYLFEEYRRARRSIAKAIAECAIPYKASDLTNFVSRVDHRKDGKVLEVIYEP
jgi:hypothetical protein